jgi:hypothetical protein
VANPDKADAAVVDHRPGNEYESLGGDPTAVDRNVIRIRHGGADATPQDSLSFPRWSRHLP